jgi:hypothetical protein
MHRLKELSLAANIIDNRLQVNVENRQEETLRIWARSNSWGWGMLKLSISETELISANYMLILMDKIWTRNGPNFIEIGSGQDYLLEVVHEEQEWENLGSIDYLRSMSLSVTVVLDIPETQEALDLGVFIGQSSSNALISSPPHNWLFKEI